MILPIILKLEVTFTDTWHTLSAFYVNSFNGQNNSEIRIIISIV